jgi:NAD(P)-dependent dehydrogenase (short-subunit alcohol dehydrogenase family)
MRYVDGAGVTAERRAAREGIRLETGRRCARGDRNPVIAKDHAAGLGRIVNTCSDALFGAGLSVYAGGKGVVPGLTTSSAAAGVAHGMKVNAVVPTAATRMSLGRSGTTNERPRCSTTCSPPGTSHG